MRFLAIGTLTLLFNFQAQANPEAKKAALEYQLALDKKDKAKLKESVTEEYFNSLSKNNLIERLFKEKRKESDKKSYQVEVIESKVVKGSVMASIKPKKKDEHDHKTWVQLKKVNGKYLVSGESHLD